MVGGRGVNRQGGYPGLLDRVTLSAGVKFCHVNVEGRVTRVARVGFVIHQIREKFTLAVVLHHY